ncbi:MAG: RagB/SusD family nutrient uptake outer membrane protein [Chitinophagaceae bacterium]|nr:RagB/SusD family nutrient uptake outer membrane protein [Chitinophagaceae bacterium]
MFNKKISILFIAVSALGLLSSCKKYLEKDPIDKLTPDQAFSTEANLKLYINGFYLMLPNANNIYQSELTSDLTVRKEVPPYLLSGFSAQSALAFHASAAPWTWTNLRNINYFIENNKNETIPAAVRDHYTGIARFFRAYFYFNMVKIYGDVPWYGKTMDPADPDLFKPRDPRSLVMDSVLADLDFAVKNIYDTKDAGCTQVTRPVAYAFKSRVCLFEGSFRKYHSVLPGTETKWFTESAAAADSLIKSAKYSLQKTTNSDIDYRSLFINETPTASETLLSAVSNNTLRKWHGSNNWYNSLTAGDRLSLNKRFVNTYLNLDGTRFTDNPGYATIEFQNEVKNRDKRLQQTIRTPQYKRSDGSQAGPDFIVTTTGYQLLKFSTDDKALDAIAQNFNSIPIMRYAEVLLNYAEAKAELGTFTPADWTLTIAALRLRAGLTNTSMPIVADPYLIANFYPNITDPVLLEIRRDRAIELVGEFGYRYEDLVRWKLGTNIPKSYDGIYVPAKGQILDLSDNGAQGAGDVCFVDALPSTRVAGVTYVVLTASTFRLQNGNSGILQWLSNTARTWDDKRYFYPLPPNEIIINPQLKQNDGWQ